MPQDDQSLIAAAIVIVSALFFALHFSATSILGADEAELSACRGSYVYLVNGFKAPRVIHIAFSPQRIAALLPGHLSTTAPPTWLRRLVFRRKFYQPMADDLQLESKVTVNGPASLAQVFQPGRWYNFVITDDGLAATEGRLDGRSLVDKHIGLSGFDRNVHFAGRILLDGSGNAFVSSDSGTFNPPPSLLGPAAQLLEEEVPGLHIETIDHSHYANLLPLVRADPTKDRFHQDESYHQDHPSYVDIEGDIHLIRSLAKWTQLVLRPWRVPAILKAYKKANEGRAGTVHPGRLGEETGLQKAVIVPRLLNRMRQIFQEFPQYTPHIGPAPQWSPEAAIFLHDHNVFPLFNPPDKLLASLGVGRSSDFNRTGLEENLEKTLLSYPDRSVQIDTVLREAYRLSEGDLTKALLTAENILSKDATAGAARDRAALQQKLAYIRNDSKPIFDNYGAWYHTFGTALYALVAPHWKAGLVSTAEILMSHFGSNPDAQEENANTIGVDLGYGLRRLVETGKFQRPLPADARTDYMNLTEFAPHS